MLPCWLISYLFSGLNVTLKQNFAVNLRLICLAAGNRRVKATVKTDTGNRANAVSGLGAYCKVRDLSSLPGRSGDPAEIFAEKAMNIRIVKTGIGEGVDELR